MSDFERFEEKLARMAAAMERMAPPARDVGPCFGDLWQSRLKAKTLEDPKWSSIESRMKPVLAWFESWPAAQVDKHAWAEYRAARREMPGKTDGKVGSLTVDLELDQVKAMYYWAEDEKLIDTNPVARIKRSGVKPNRQAPMKEEHLEMVLDACPTNMLRAYFLAGADAGPRQMEILHIQRPLINARTLEVSLIRTKGDKPRVIILTHRAIAALLAVEEVPGTDYVFAHRWRGHVRRYSERRFGQLVKAVIQKAGIERYYPGKKMRSHGLRRGYATNALERDVDLRAIQEQLGHSTLAVTEKYIDARRDHLHEAARRFELGIKGRRGPHRAPAGIPVDPMSNLLDTCVAS